MTTQFVCFTITYKELKSYKLYRKLKLPMWKHQVLMVEGGNTNNLNMTVKILLKN